MQKLPEATHELYSPEALLLLACARRSMDAPGRARLRTALAWGVDWHRVAALAARHRMAPLLHWHLTREAAGSVPARVASSLRRAFEANAATSLQLTGELKQILDVFEEQGIAAVPYKGPVLAEQLYGNVALRRMGDLDLLVKPADVPRARALLAERGFEPPPQLTASQVRTLLRRDCNLPLVRARDQLVLELHWAFAAGAFSFGLDWNEIEPRLESRDFAGREVPVFTPEDQMLILCFHGTRHMWERVEWIAGVAELIRAGLDWETVLLRADRLGMRRMVLTAAALAAELMDTPIPEDVATRISGDPTVQRLTHEVQGRLFTGTGELAHTLGVAFHIFQLRALQRLRHRLRYVAYGAMAPAKEDWTAVELPAALAPLYVLIRPFRIARQYLARATGRLVATPEQARGR
jgi:hypothetical protein